METYHRTRIEIFVRKASLAELTRLIDAEPEVRGYTVLPCLGGRGSGGERVPDPLTDALSEVCVVAIASEAPARRLVAQAIERLGHGIGAATLMPVEVVRADRF